MSDNQQCAECGMHTETNEYHPYAACLIFKQTSSSKAVHENLKAVLDEGANRWRSVAEQLANRMILHRSDAINQSSALWSQLDREALAAFDSLRKEGL